MKRPTLYEYLMGGTVVPPISECFIGWYRMEQIDYDNCVEAILALKNYGTKARAAKATRSTCDHITRMMVMAKEVIVYE